MFRAVFPKVGASAPFRRLQLSRRHWPLNGRLADFENKLGHNKNSAHVNICTVCLQHSRIVLCFDLPKPNLLSCLPFRSVRIFGLS